MEVGEARNTVSRFCARMAPNVTFRLLRGQVHHQRAIHSRLRGAGRKFLQAVLQNGIEIAEQDDGSLHRLAPGRESLQDLAQRRAGAQRPLRSALDHRAVRQRIGKRHAQFDHVHARTVERQQQLPRGVQVGIARRQINHQALGVFRAQVAETGQQCEL